MADEKPQKQLDEKISSADHANKRTASSSEDGGGGTPSEKDETVVNLDGEADKKTADEGEKGGVGSYIVRTSSLLMGIDGIR